MREWGMDIHMRVCVCLCWPGVRRPQARPRRIRAAQDPPPGRPDRGQGQPGTHQVSVCVCMREQEREDDLMCVCVRLCGCVCRRDELSIFPTGNGDGITLLAPCLRMLPGKTKPVGGRCRCCVVSSVVW
jgi:hypothetical protein